MAFFTSQPFGTIMSYFKSSNSDGAHIGASPKRGTDVQAVEEKTKEFVDAANRAIQTGALTFSALMHASLLREKDHYAQKQQQYNAQAAKVDALIEATAKALPASQRERYLLNVNKQDLLRAQFRQSVRVNTSTKVRCSGRYGHLQDAFGVYNPLSDANMARALADAAREPGISAMVEAFNTNPLGEALIAQKAIGTGLKSIVYRLALEQACQSPGALQELVQRHVEHLVFNEVPLVHLTEEFFAELNLHKTYTDDDKSRAVYNELSHAPLRLEQIEQLPYLVAQLLPKERQLLNALHVQQFATTHLIHSDKPVQVSALEKLEAFVHNDAPVESRDGATIARLANLLLHRYPIDAIVPMLENYQGNRALDGSIRADQLVTDVRSYLQERLTGLHACTTMPEL